MTKKRPPFGLHLPCKLLEVRDGDTVVVTISGGYRWPVRLKDCWAPEKHTPEGKAAKAKTEEILAKAEQLSLFVELDQAKLATEDVNILKLFTTFDRLVGHLFIDDENTLNEELVRAGHATRAKQ